MAADPKQNFSQELSELSSIMENLEKKGKVSSKASQENIRHKVKLSTPNESLEILFIKADKYKNGWLNYDEFQKLLDDYTKGTTDLTQEQKDRCFIYVNKSETGKVTLDEIAELVPILKETNFAPEISEEMMELIRSQPVGQEVDEGELLRVGWDLIGTSIDGDEDPEDVYDIKIELGKGTFSKVFKCTEKSTGKLVALKIIDIPSAGEEIYDLQHEITFQLGCNSSNICKYYRSYIRGTELWVFLEYLGGGTLTEVLAAGTLSEDYIKVIVRELVRGLAYLHCRDFLHRDVKPDNIRLSDAGELKICDFRVSSSLSAMHSTFAGTPLYLAPEVILENLYDQKVDIWSLGITCYELAKGSPPYIELPIVQALAKIPDDVPPKLEGPFSEKFKEFISLCLTKDAKQRPSALELLSHPFLTTLPGDPTLSSLIGRPPNSFDSSKLVRFRSVRRDRAPSTESESKQITSNLSRKPTGVGPNPLEKRAAKKKEKEAKEKEKETKEGKEGKEGREKKEKKEHKDREHKEHKEKDKEKKKKVKVVQI